MLDYPESFRELIRQLRRLPGIGPRSAERIALWMLQSARARPEELAAVINRAIRDLRTCRLCGFFTEQDICSLCADSERQGKELCVVEMATDILPLERIGIFRGRYHSLGGKLSPLDGIGPQQLRIGQLLQRLDSEEPSEIILALSADVEGEATAHYISELIAPRAIKLTRLAQGLPAGGGIEQADPITLQRALMNRLNYT